MRELKCFVVAAANSVAVFGRIDIRRNTTYDNENCSYRFHRYFIDIRSVCVIDKSESISPQRATTKATRSGRNGASTDHNNNSTINFRTLFADAKSGRPVFWRRTTDARRRTLSA